VDFLGKPILADAHGLEKLFLENFAGVRIRNRTHAEAFQ
jgi:hypothetical protein